mmetsp:Transcript_10512/g.14745  ORF Transcript_10512/g.14745 Transcript_10512/m.14745 type:complete len:337 (-) Transcript_10512:724-1734(-)|eukprot:CAMPEP_0185732500 /NCGR_PEP_ID=MMETSP1171-20130828/16432_1 /TAXON_ID=374046 /ORGANISM="Helicotheca tamensis, Strain CCMP826" /LENGTH=336 /DNA_ID=CAMNT_0028402007 /DNA_START=112 /DNA_END=1122 /DNA_ORIENTATION=+
MTEKANFEAIEESLALARKDETEPKEFILDEHHVCDYKGRQGVIQQYNTVNQFHPSFQKIIDEYNTTSMLCGYLSIVHARLLHQFFQSNNVSKNTPLSSDWAKSAVDMITSDTERIMEDTAEVMKRIQHKRKKYVQINEEEFEDETSKKYYERALVADYEISDELFRCGKPLDSVDGKASDDDEDNEKNINIYLWRPNNYPEAKYATHEERSRIEAEDSVFGNDVKYIIERKRTQHEHMKEGGYNVERFSPNDWHKKLVSNYNHVSAEEKEITNIFIVNIHGHFCTCISTRIYDEANKNIHGSFSPALFFFNTYQGKIISGNEDSTMGCMYDTIFQ